MERFKGFERHRVWAQGLKIAGSRHTTVRAVSKDEHRQKSNPIARGQCTQMSSST